MRIGFDEKYKSLSIFDFPKLRLKKKEVAQLLLIEQDAVVAFTHYVAAGEDSDYTGYYHCQGDFETMCRQGFDERCPFCKAAQSGQAGVAAARRRFVNHVIRYRTDSMGKLITPVSVELLLWVYADDKYNNITAKRQNWGDLRKHDIQVTCTREKFQAFDLEVMQNAVWITDPAVKNLVVNTYQQNKRSDEDLMTLLGRRVDLEAATKLLAALRGAPIPEGRQAPGAIPSGSPADLLGDLGGPPPDKSSLPGAEPAPIDNGTVKQPAGAMDFSDLLNV